ncbi:MAG: hypothetical protein RMK18_03260 [Armatimonadota bacterium]|nr:hypothetical protein [Armatimonadota bacterium]MDW8024868.1 hypothetical protein [Armatimonadota bacterium]
MEESERPIDLVSATGENQTQKWQSKPQRSDWQNWLQLIIDTLQVPIDGMQTDFEVAGGVKIRLWRNPSVAGKRVSRKDKLSNSVRSQMD